MTAQESSTDKIKLASCDNQCPASKSEYCCHVMAVIWKLEDMTRKGELKECDHRNHNNGVREGKEKLTFHQLRLQVL